MRRRAFTQAAAGMLALQPAWATPVYRCGADGNEYAERPCTGPGERLPPSAPDRPDPAAGAEVAARERALADALTQARQAREARMPGGAAIIRPSRTPWDEDTPPRAAQARSVGPVRYKPPGADRRGKPPAAPADETPDTAVPPRRPPGRANRR